MAWSSPACTPAGTPPAAACGAVVMVLTVLTFAAINTASPNLAAVGGLFALDAAVNVAMLLVAARFTK